MDYDVEEPYQPYGEELTENEVKRLIDLGKNRVNDEEHRFPDGGETLEIPLISLDERENFLLSVTVGRIDLSKSNNQLRLKPENIPLVRIDVGNTIHKNPDGTIITGPHIHIYKEGYGLKFAYPLEKYLRTNPEDTYQVLCDFMNYCSIVKKPVIIKGVTQW